MDTQVGAFSSSSSSFSTRSSPFTAASSSANSGVDGVACKNADAAFLCRARHHSAQRFLVSAGGGVASVASKMLAFPEDGDPLLLSDKTCTKFGFVVTRRRRRTLSLDSDYYSTLTASCSAASASALAQVDEAVAMGRTARSQDDSCIPFLYSECTSVTQLKREFLQQQQQQRGSISNRSQSFDCRNSSCTKPRHEAFYDLVASPGPKFLEIVGRRNLQQQQQQEEEAHLELDFKVPASVPFKWEIAPGKPKPEVADAKPDPALQLPPRLLLLRSLTTSSGSNSSSRTSSPDHGRRAHSVNHRQSLLLGISSAASASSPKKQQGASSPNSVFCGPKSASSSSSASSSDCEYSSRSAVVVSDAESGVENPRTGAAAALAGLDESNDLGPQKSSLVESISRFIGRVSLSRKKRRQKRQQRSSEMWAPTLAAYFHSLSSSNNGHLALLGGQAGAVDPKSVTGSPGGEQVSTSSSKVESNELQMKKLDEVDGYCGCASPGFSSSSSLKRLGSRRQKKWVVARLRRGSRVLQTIVSRVMKQGMHSRPGSSSRLLYHQVRR